MQRSFFPFFIFYLLISCAGHQKKELTQFGEVRTIEYQYEILFKATRDHLKERGYQVTKANIKTGEIETDYRPGAGWKNTSNID